MGLWAAEADQRTGGVEQPVERSADLVGAVARGQVAIDVLDGRLEHVEPVVQIVERSARDDQLGLADAELGGPTARLVVALTARSPAVPPGPARSGREGESPTAPETPLLFRHSDETTGNVRQWRGTSRFVPFRERWSFSARVNEADQTERRKACQSPH